MFGLRVMFHNSITVKTGFCIQGKQNLYYFKNLVRDYINCIYYIIVHKITITMMRLKRSMITLEKSKMTNYPEEII